MEDIFFFSLKIKFKFKNPKKTSNWLSKICQNEGRGVESLSYIFCSDNYLADLNKKYLNHSTLTDILTFDYSNSNRVNGEIYISIARVKENARIFNQTFDSELRRVLSHGLLHLIGYNDKTPSQKSEMRRKEEACLSLWK